MEFSQPQCVLILQASVDETTRQLQTEKDIHFQKQVLGTHFFRTCDLQMDIEEVSVQALLTPTSFNYDEKCWGLN